MMDSPMERMPIACVHCAKAKAKCDKKVPCSRCVGKQIVCQSRATRRSSHNPSRRSQLPRQHSERALHTAGAFQVSHFSSPPRDGSLMSPNHMSPHGIHGHRLSLPDIAQPMRMTQAIYGQDIEPHMLRNGFTQTPPDINIPITPVMTHLPQLDNFVNMNGTHFDHDGDNNFLTMSGNQSSMLEFDTPNIMTDFMSPPSLMQDMHDHYLMSGKGMAAHTPAQMSLNGHEGSMRMKGRHDFESPPQYMTYRPSSRPSPTSPSSRGLQEPDAVLASHQSWPFFQCNPSEKFTLSPPKTARIYLEGLEQTLRNQDTWQAWTTQLDERTLENGLDECISTEPMFAYSREKLLAITQGFLHKALDIHRAGGHGNREDSPGSPGSGHGSFLMLPPPDVMQYFLKGYAVRYEPYYSSIPGGRLNPNSLMQSSNSKAASLMVLLMVATGAAATPTVEARYLTSGLTEACRISLFDMIEKDISQSREPLILRSGLLFITLAAWSGDKWHMDIAMGQRGMYLAMLSHAGMLEAFQSRIDLGECQRDPEKVWEDWKEHEGKHRLAHSWVMVDQEMSLFSDTMPLLSVDNLHVAMPDADALWQAASATEWLSIFEKLHGSTYQSPSSARDLFTRFVDGELANCGNQLSPTQLRLLLHPLQALVCQLRQFISCLPDGGSHAKASRAVSKAATKARLEEISALLQQWYSISRQSSSNKKGKCWTTCANLIVYHLISLNAVTSFKCIEQFARKEVHAGGYRHASWLQMRCIDQAEEAFFHCGQVLRLIKSMPVQVRPPWWAGAIYRVALTAWANSMAHSGTRFPSSGQNGEADKPFPIDNLTPEQEAISRYLKYQEGVPMLSKPDGSLLSMDVPAHVLNHCIDILEDDSSMRLTDGIKRKLRMFAANWKET